MAMLVWKHHLALDFEAGVPVAGNGVGIEGTVFTDFDRMISWLGEDAEGFYVAPIEMSEEELDFNFSEPFMATSKVNKLSLGPFVPLKQTGPRTAGRRKSNE